MLGAVEIDLSLNQLTGTIPEELYRLENLGNLLLNSNHQQIQGSWQGGLSGTISPNITNLSRLSVLHLDNNLLTGTIPDGVWSLTYLTELFLGGNNYNNNLSSSIGNLVNLQQFDIESAGITGTIPSELWSLDKLFYLNIGLNLMTGTISTDVSKLKRLTQLSLKSSPDPHVSQHFSGTFPTTIWQLTKLQYLYISYNSLTGTIPTAVEAMVDLVILDLGSNRCGDLYLPPSLPPSGRSMRTSLDNSELELVVLLVVDRQSEWHDSTRDLLAREADYLVLGSQSIHVRLDAYAAAISSTARAFSLLFSCHCCVCLSVCLSLVVSFLT